MIVPPPGGDPAVVCEAEVGLRGVQGAGGDAEEGGAAEAELDGGEGVAQAMDGGLPGGAVGQRTRGVAAGLAQQALEDGGDLGSGSRRGICSGGGAGRTHLKNLLPVLLRSLELAGCIVTIDAMGCQKKIAREIVDADADYVLALKGSQETVHDEVKRYMDDAVDQWTKAPASVPALDYYENVEKDHGRIETRRFWQSDRVDWFADRDHADGDHVPAAALP